MSEAAKSKYATLNHIDGKLVDAHLRNNGLTIGELELEDIEKILGLTPSLSTSGRGPQSDKATSDDAERAIDPGLAAGLGHGI